MTSSFADKLKRVIEDKRPILVDFGLILILGLLSLSWFRGDNLISGGDYDWILSWKRFLKQIFSVWDPTISFGIYRPLGVFITFALPGALMETIGFPPSFIEKLYFYFWFAGSGLSMYFLAFVLGAKRIGRLAAAVFYMLNPFSLMIIWRVSHGHIQGPYAFAPLLLGLFIFGYIRKIGCRFVVLANLFLYLINGSSYSNPRHLLMQWIPVGFFFMAALLVDRKEALRLFKYTFKFIASFFILNSLSFFPWLRDLQGYVAGAHSPVLLSDADELRLTSVGLLKAIRMLGYWSLYSGYKGEPYYAYWRFYTLLLPNLISWLIPVMVILGFFQKEFRVKRHLFFSLGVIIFCLWGIKGPLPPLGGIISWLYQRIPYLLTAARFSFLLYGLPVYLIFSLLVGFGFITVYDFLFRKIKNLALIPPIILLFLLCGVLVYPFWNGEVINQARKVIPGERFKVPDYWREGGQFLDNQLNFFRVLPLPMGKTYNTAAYWGEGYSGADLTRWLTQKPVITTNTGQSFALAEAIGAVVEKENEFSDVGKLMGLMSVKYLILRNDTRWEMLRGHNWWFAHDEKNINSFLEKQSDLMIEKEIGKLKFYKINENWLLPEIYSPRELVYVEGGVEAAEDLASFLKTEEREAVLFAGQNKKEVGLETEILSQYFIWQEPKPTESRTEAIYEVEVARSGEYEIYLRDDGLLTYYKLAQSWLEVKVDNQPTEQFSLEKTDHNLVRLGSLYLTVGNHQISLRVPSPINLLANGSFEEGQWPAVELFSTNKSSDEATFILTADAREGKNSLQISSGQNPVAAYTTINHFRLTDKYQVYFSAKHLQGKEPIFVIWQNDDRVEGPIWNPKINQFGTADPLTYFSSTKLAQANTWQDYNFVFKSQAGIKSAGVAFINEPNAINNMLLGVTKNLFDNVNVERVFGNPILLRLSITGTKISNPEITFKEIGAARYQVNVKRATEPYLLVLSTAFDSGWNSSVGGRHLLVNGYANGWLVDRKGDYVLFLDYLPQKQFTIGLSVFIGMIIFSLIYLGVMTIGRRK